MNIEAKEDRRVRKTKKALREGLAELLTEKSIQNITVRELTDKADVHRSTFYANFVDIYDLYNHIEETVINELRDIFNVTNGLDTTQCIVLLFEYISTNKQISCLVLGSHVGTSFIHSISTVFKDIYIDYWRTTININLPSDKLEIYALFLFSGHLGVIREWAVNDFNTSQDELLEIISAIDINTEMLIRRKFA
ncbi:MAG: TetR family transcriptional regulator C-terminal domain-containing protein [Oscillospiraceae bacterium]|nr:TetR family transcriptional regulator C-terminal domain-containing protein [Oscillospiraceae bacterium]